MNIGENEQELLEALWIATEEEGQAGLPLNGEMPAGGNDLVQHNLAVNRLIAPLRDLEPGQTGSIAYIQLNHSAHVNKLMAMGVLPGAPITLRQRFPSFVFDAGYSQFAVDDEIAADIYVRLVPR
ncbi:MAG: FeoA family protein [Anaerolineae bacterium]